MTTTKDTYIKAVKEAIKVYEEGLSQAWRTYCEMMNEAYEVYQKDEIK